MAAQSLRLSALVALLLPLGSPAAGQTSESTSYTLVSSALSATGASSLLNTAAFPSIQVAGTTVAPLGPAGVSTGPTTGISLEAGFWLGAPIDPSDPDGDGADPDNCPFTTNPSQTDTDGDGMGNACDEDDDNDGLSDEDETNIYGTDPLDDDTDGDGFSDGDEVNSGTDPLDDTSFPAGVSVPALPLPLAGLLALGLACTGVRSARRSKRAS